jgi:HEPN domain-containing protein
MEDWEVAIDKAGQNISAAKLLYDGHLYGLSAYHAQQALELSIKAGAYKMGFLQYVKKKPPLRSHNPPEVILPFVYDFLIDLVQEIDKSKLDDWIKRGLDEPLEIFRMIRDNLYRVKKNDKLKENLWRSSLKIEIHDKDILDLKKKLDDYANNRLTIYMERIMYFLQDLVCCMINELKKTRHSEKIPPLIKECEGELAKYGLPSILIRHFINRNETAWKNELVRLVEMKGESEALDIILGPGGALTMLQKHNSRLSLNQKWSVNDQLKITWITYVSAISPLVLQIYPHEEFGRYPITRPDFDTEKTYAERKIELKAMIDQCESLHARISKMLDAKSDKT